MKTLQQFASKPETVPASTSWYLADLGEARGKQELFTKQSPQRLKVLREHALIESVVPPSEGIREGRIFRDSYSALWQAKRGKPMKIEYDTGHDLLNRVLNGLNYLNRGELSNIELTEHLERVERFELFEPGRPAVGRGTAVEQG